MKKTGPIKIVAYVLLAATAFLFFTNFAFARCPAFTGENGLVVIECIKRDPYLSLKEKQASIRNIISLIGQKLDAAKKRLKKLEESLAEVQNALRDWLLRYGLDTKSKDFAIEEEVARRKGMTFFAVAERCYARETKNKISTNLERFLACRESEIERRLGNVMNQPMTVR